MRLYSPSSALADAHRAYAAALGRRTVILALPLNVQGSACEPGPVPALRRTYPTAPAAEAVTALAEVLRGARRPVFIAGRGARHGANSDGPGQILGRHTAFEHPFEELHDPGFVITTATLSGDQSLDDVRTTMMDTLSKVENDPLREQRLLMFNAMNLT
jgi:hypothetical protein